MIFETKMGVASVIRNTLKLKPKHVPCGELNVGDYFECFDRVFIYIGDGKAIDEDGFKVSFTDEYVRPIRVKVEYDYRLIDEDGKEATYL